MKLLFRFDDFEFDLASRELRQDGRVVELQPKVFAVLALLVERRGEALGKDDFLEQVWSGRFVTENVLSRCIRALRKALGDDASAPRFIRTVRGYGYEFVGAVEEATDNRVATSPVRLAVLPFQSIVPAEMDPALELGLADTLVNDLSGIEGVIVRPLAAVQDAAAGQAVTDPIALGRKLDVDVLIESRLQASGGRLRLNTRAVRIPQGTALMAERLEAEITDLFDVQDRLCGRITESLLLRLGADGPNAGHRRCTPNLAAYRAYIDGRLKLARHSVESMRQALEHFEHAIELDPAYVEAHIGIAEANDSLATLGVDHARHHELTRKAAQHALKLNPDNARAHCCLGKVAWQYDWEWEHAGQLLHRATELDPGDADALIALSDFLCFQARPREGLQVAERAGEINPFSPWIQSLIAQALYMNGQLEEAVDQARRATELAPDFGFGRLFLALSLFHLGRTQEAIGHLQEAIERTGRQDFVGALGFVLARIGDEGGARRILEQINQASEAGPPVPPISSAIVHSGLGEHERAIHHLRRVVAERSWHVLLLHADPVLAETRARPEGLALLREIGLPA